MKEIFRRETPLGLLIMAIKTAYALFAQREDLHRAYEEAKQSRDLSAVAAAAKAIENFDLDHPEIIEGILAECEEI